MNRDEMFVTKIIKPGKKLRRGFRFEKVEPCFVRFECPECGCVFDVYSLAAHIMTRPFGEEIAPATYCLNCHSYAREVMRYEIEPTA